jgi:multiple antibiotic resistance protein
MPFDVRTNLDASVHEIVQAVVTVLAVINPVVCGAIFLALTPKLESHVGRGTQAIVTRFMGLIVASLGMQFVLTGLKAFLA